MVNSVKRSVVNKLSVQSEDNILSPDGASSQINGRNTLNWLGYPAGGPVPFPAPAVAAIGASAPDIIQISHMDKPSGTGGSPFTLNPFISTPVVGNTLIAVMVVQTDDSGTPQTTDITAVEDNFGHAFTPIPGFEGSCNGGFGLTFQTYAFYLPAAFAGTDEISVHYTTTNPSPDDPGIFCTVYELSPSAPSDASNVEQDTPEFVTTINGPGLSAPAGVYITLPGIIGGGTTTVDPPWAFAGGSAIPAAWDSDTGAQEAVFNVSGGTGTWVWTIGGVIFS